jgi:riboflavin-specific deaminase-like protein
MFFAGLFHMPKQVISSGTDAAPPLKVEAANEGLWNDFVDALQSDRIPAPSRWADMFAPLRAGKIDRMLVVGQLGQSLDGRIATHTGHSKYINGSAGLAHLHRLRAVVDAVVVGIGTALADDPLLTVRLVAGRHPARVVIDPKGRVPANAKLFADDGVRRIVITTEHSTPDVPPGVEILRLPSLAGQLAPAAILQALAGVGLNRILIEGGAQTLSGFIKAGCLDRIHVIVAPIILGSGRPGFDLTPIEWIDQAMRPAVRIHLLDGEVLFDCDLSAHRTRVLPT